MPGWRVLNAKFRVPTTLSGGTLARTWIFLPHGHYPIDFWMWSQIGSEVVFKMCTTGGPDDLRHGTAFDALQAAAECIAELIAEGVDIKVDSWPMGES